MKTVAITGCNGSVGQRVVLYFLKQHYNVLAIDIAPLATTLVKLLADEAGLQVQQDASGERFRFARVDLARWDDTLECLKAGTNPRQPIVVGGDADSQGSREGRLDGIVHLGAFRDPGDYVVQSHNTNVVANYNVLRAAAELGITRVAQASSVNVFPLAYSKDENMKFSYFPLDEDHPNNVDEPYGLSKVIAELQATSICARYPSVRVASLRLHWSVPSIEAAQSNPLESDDRSRKDLWGWIQEDEGARAFWLSLTVEKSPSGPVSIVPGTSGLGWEGHEAFIIAASTTRCPGVRSEVLKQRWFPNVPIKRGAAEIEGRRGFFDCSKAEKLLGWVHL